MTQDMKQKAMGLASKLDNCVTDAQILDYLQIALTEAYAAGKVARDTADDGDCLSSRPDFHKDQIQQLEFELATELEQAELNVDDYVTINRKKLNAIATRVIDRLRNTITTDTQPQSVSHWGIHD